MLILGIESSCDETAAAVIEDGTRVRSNVIYSQIATHKRFGGVVPELASREHLEKIDGVVAEALQQAGVTYQTIDAIAVTQGPGLVGRCPGCHRFVLFSLGKKERVVKATAFGPAVLPDDWSQRAYIVERPAR